MNTRPGFSSVPLAGPGQRGHLIVLEGMPGAGKTTAAAALEEHGRQVAGEYTDDTGATIAAGDHPPAWDNDAHQQNWLRKTAQCGTWLSRGTTEPPVVSHEHKRAGLFTAAQVPDLTMPAGYKRSIATWFAQLGSERASLL
jgi:hypothetical protein